MDEYTLDDFLKYRASLQDGMTNKSNKIFYNDSFVHAAMVLKAIIDKSIVDNDLCIKMYCGEFSIFRDAARTKLAAIKEKIKPTHLNSMNSWETFDPYCDLINSLRNFFEFNGKFHLIVERGAGTLKSEDVWTIIQGPIQKEQMTIVELKSPSGLDHFAVSGNSYRRENSDMDKTALCCFNDPITAALLQKDFQLLSNVAN